MQGTSGDDATTGGPEGLAPARSGTWGSLKMPLATTRWLHPSCTDAPVSATQLEQTALFICVEAGHRTTSVPQVGDPGEVVLLDVLLEGSLGLSAVRPIAYSRGIGSSEKQQLPLLIWVSMPR